MNIKLELTGELYKQYETQIEQFHQRGLLIDWGGDSRRENGKTIKFYTVELLERFVSFIDKLTQGGEVENPMQEKMLAFITAAGIEIPAKIENMSGEQVAEIERELAHELALAEEDARVNTPSAHIDAPFFSYIVGRYNEDILPRVNVAEQAMTAFKRWLSDYNAALDVDKPMPAVPQSVWDIVNKG